MDVETTQAQVLAIPKATKTQRGCNQNLGHVQTAATKNGLVSPLDSHVYLNSGERWSVQARLVIGGVMTHHWSQREQEEDTPKTRMHTHHPPSLISTGLHFEGEALIDSSENSAR